MFDLLTIGDCTVDTYAMIDDRNPDVHLSSDKKLLCLDYADKISVFEAGEAVGGNAANIAVGARRLGLKSALCTELGTDFNGEFIVQQLKKEKVDTSLVHKNKRNKTRYSLVLNYRGERTILSYHSKRKYPLPSLPKTEWVYYTSLGEGFELLQNKLITSLRKHPETKLAVNPGSYQMKKGLLAFKKILAVTDLLFVNLEEAQKLSGAKLPLPKLFAKLHDLGAEMIVITDGAKGSYASDGIMSYFLPPFPAKNISKTGAGDAYASGFLSAIFKGYSITEAMQWGNANAASVIGHIGAQTGLGNPKILKKILSKNTNITSQIL